MTLPSVSAVIVNFNGGLDLISCLEGLRLQTHRLAEVVVVDNASDDQSLQLALSRFPQITPIRNSQNEGFAAAANQGARAARGDVLLFLNPDVSLAPESVQLVSEQLAHAPGAVGAAVTLDADTDDLYGSTIDRLGYPTGLRRAGEPLYVAGAAFATSRALFLRLGGLDERYFMFVEDVDYCWRVLLAGFEISSCAEARARHRGGAAAIGGYVRAGRLETTSFRFLHRERNTLAMLLKCAPLEWFVWLIPAYIGKTGILAAGAICIGRLDVARGLIAGLIWNCRELRRTLLLRRNVPRTQGGERSARRRIYQGWLAVERMRQFGLPRFVDRGGHARL